MKRHHERLFFFTLVVFLADLLDSSFRCFVWITKFTFPYLTLIIAQVLKEKMVKNDRFCSFTNNKQSCEWSCQRFRPGVVLESKLENLCAHVRESGFRNREMFACGIWNPENLICGIRNPGIWDSGIQLKEFRIHLTIRIRNPRIWNPRWGIQNPRLSWILYMRREYSQTAKVQISRRYLYTIQKRSLEKNCCATQWTRLRRMKWKI